MRGWIYNYAGSIYRFFLKALKLYINYKYTLHIYIYFLRGKKDAYIYIKECGGRVYLSTKCSMLKYIQLYGLFQTWRHFNTQTKQACQCRQATSTCFSWRNVTLRGNIALLLDQQGLWVWNSDKKFAIWTSTWQWCI